MGGPKRGSMQDSHEDPAQPGATGDGLLIGFDLRPGDSQDFEAWLAGKLPLSVPQLRVGFIAFAFVGFAVWYRYPLAVDVAAPHVVIPLIFAWLGATALQAINRLAARRYRPAPLMTEGTHALRLLPSGVQHVGPQGTDTYPWSQFSEVNLTRDHVFLCFRDLGTLVVPVSALKSLGPGCEDRFISQVESLVARRQPLPAP